MRGTETVTRGPCGSFRVQDNEPSLAIIRRLGFTQTGEAMDEEDGLELVFELER